MRVYIVGLPGTGKSYFGRQLARSLKLQFFDLDDCIEKQEKMTVREIIESKGETFFRENERDILFQLTNKSNTIIACGGGTPMFYHNMDVMKRSGIVIWLNTDLELITKRIAKNISRRPLFVGLSEPEINNKLQALFEKRKKIYAKADIFIESKFAQAFTLNTVIQKVMRISQRRFK